MAAHVEGSLLWTPSDAIRQGCELTHYMRWLADRKGRQFEGYADLWRWSVGDIDAFWGSLAEYFELMWHSQPSAVLGLRGMPGAQWFPGGTLNYAEHVFRHIQGDKPAVVFWSETGAPSAPAREAATGGQPSLRKRTMSWYELHAQTAALANSLRELGVGFGDRVVAYAPNMPETLVAFLACASLGAVWSSCSPDIGAAAVADRFKQIEPRLMFAVDGYIYNGRINDRRELVRELVAHLPTLQHVVHITYLGQTENHGIAAAQSAAHAHEWRDLVRKQPDDTGVTLSFTAVPFDHPLWVLYSSGTTGLPKPITHSHGGIVIEHHKGLALHSNLGRNDVFFWFTTTGWMMWNKLIGGLLVGSTIVLYDGSPALDNMDILWRMTEEVGVTLFGASAAYIGGCIKAGLKPRKTHDLSRLKSIGSTGSPLPVEGFDWIYDEVKPDVWLVSISGGTDVCAAFVGGNPLWPVYAGEIQCRMLGCAVEAFDEHGVALDNEVGELVITQPMPSMPVFFWNDPGMARYRASYFEMFDGVWRHGDWVKITAHDGIVIYGRSDSTINRHGVRMGTSEIYSAVEDMPEVQDALIIDLEMLGRASFMPLFVVLREGYALDGALAQKINANIRARLSARQIPDAIYAIAEVPRTLNGKKMEVPVKKILLGTPVEKAVTQGSMSNPASLRFFVELAARLKQAV